MADGSISDASGGKFPAVDANGELNPGVNKDFQVDSVSSEIATSREIKERAKTQEKEKKGKGKKDSMQTLKTAILVSAVVVAVAGAAFAITKKLKEK